MVTRLRDPGPAAARRSSPRWSAHGIKVDAHRLRQLSAEFTQRMAALRGRGLQARRPQLQPGLAQAAGRGPVRRAQPRRAGPQDQDRRLRHRRRGAGGAGAGRARAAARDPRLAPAAEADPHLHRRAGRAGRPRHRPRPHLLQPGRHLDRPAVLQRPQPAEHPDPHRGGPQDPRGLRARGRLPAGLGRLLADRAAHPGRTWPTSRRSRRRSPRTSTSTRSPPRRCSACPWPRSAPTCAARPRRSITASSTASAPSAWPSAWAFRRPRRKDYIERYFEQYPGIRAYMDRAKAEAREKGYVTTLYGRRCYIPEINVKLPSRRAYAERAAINAPIQGTRRRHHEARHGPHLARPQAPAARGPHAAPGPRRAGVRGAGGAGRRTPRRWSSGRWSARPRCRCRWWSRSGTGRAGRRRTSVRRRTFSPTAAGPRLPADRDRAPPPARPAQDRFRSSGAPGCCACRRCRPTALWMTSPTRGRAAPPPRR